MPIIEDFAPQSETFQVGKPDSFADAINHIRNMIVMAMGCVKELKSQAVEKYNAPGMRIIIGEIISCLANAKRMVEVNPSSFLLR